MTNELLKPVECVARKTLSTREIVEAFIESGLHSAEIDLAITGRDYNSVYTSLHRYLKKNDLLNICVKSMDGKIILCKYEAD